MSKMYYRFGTVGSSKTARMLMDIHNDETHGRSILVLKIAMDTRWNAKMITSRVPGLNRNADALIEFPGDILDAIKACDTPPRHIYCDEIQFATRDVVEQFRDIASSGTPVMCYGLSTDWKLNLFEGSAAMFALSDEIQEVKSMCSAWGLQCTRKSMVNAKHKNHTPVFNGPQVDMGAEEAYCSMCHQHYHQFINSTGPFSQ